MEDLDQFQDKVKNSFQKVKEDIIRLDVELSQNKQALDKILTTIEALKTQLSESSKETSSNGNEGVANSQQQPTANNRRQSSTMIDNPQQPTMLPLQALKESLDSTFRSLTDREFSVFMALYTLDKEKGGNIGYSELSQQLNLSESTVRDFINILLRKNIPIQKDRYFNKKVSLSIKEEFRKLDLYQNLLKLKVNREGQRTLFDL